MVEPADGSDLSINTGVRSSGLLLLGVVTLLVTMLGIGGRAWSEVRIETVATLPTTGRRNGPGELSPGSGAVFPREPLAATPLAKLPVGDIRARGWLAAQLERVASGFVGRLPEISPFLALDDNAWLSPEGEGEHGWEELPYWLKGFVSLAFVVDDPDLQREAKRWVDGILGSQRADGYFGPRSNLVRITADDGSLQADLWPNMVALHALMTYHEATGDARVLPFMIRYFQYQASIPEKYFLLPHWQHVRGGDDLLGVFWLYDRTGESWLLELADKIQRRTAPWVDGIASWHGVNIAQGFREPANYFLRSHDPAHLAATERNYQEVWTTYGRVPGGMFGADENCRRGYTGPRQAAETCTMVEFLWSCEQLMQITGDPVWAERLEEVLFNDLPAATTPDHRALHYLTAPNLVRCDRASKSPGIQNGGPMLCFDPHDHRCCQHNFSHGWPYYVEHLWLATRDDGLAALSLAPCEVETRLGSPAVPITMEVDSRYPFRDTVTITLTPELPVRFPLYLWWPTWCERPEMSLGGEVLEVPARRDEYLRVEREWRAGDVLRVRFPMRPRYEVHDSPHRSVSITRGPLTYALGIPELYNRSGGTSEWPAWELLPDGPWNYGLVLSADDPEIAIAATECDWPASDQPFEQSASPIALEVQGRRIPEWTEDYLGLVGELQESPARTAAPLETLRLIPMGCARLRIAAFPLAGPGGIPWQRPQSPRPAWPARASHVYVGDSLEALTDGMKPGSSADDRLRRFTWWPRRGTEEWVEVDLPSSRVVSIVRVYWFDDRGAGLCRVPERWRLQVQREGEWHDVDTVDPGGVDLDRFCELRVTPVRTDGIRLVVQLREGFSGGILEIEVE